jgi:ankyrin repeat protein
VLRDLPDSLDETYERMLREIGKVNPHQAYRLLQCLAVATRPLRVDELSEVLALDFDGAKEGIPALNKDWRWDDQQQGVLSTCSSLIIVVDVDVDVDDDVDINDDDDDDSLLKTRVLTRVVQFAHFSVKEFLTSDRLSNLKTDISQFHIRSEPAHTVMAQACLAILLQSDYDERAEHSSPLSSYAAQHWIGHAQFENVSLCIEDGMQRLFDPAKPHFTVWLKAWLMSPSTIDTTWSSLWSFTSITFPHQSRSWAGLNYTSPSSKANAPFCLYYAACCGFRDLTKHLIAEYPQHVNATVGHNNTPLVAALYNGHIQVAELLYLHGAVLQIGFRGRTLLHAASKDGLMDVAQWLLKIGTDVNAQDDDHMTPLLLAAANGHLELVRTLLGYSVDVAAATTWGESTLHFASKGGHVEIVRLLIQNGADVNTRNRNQLTPLHLAQGAKMVQLLIQSGADVNAWDRKSTRLHQALSNGDTEDMQLLIQSGADVNIQDRSQSTPLHLALSKGDTKAMQLLIQSGADVNARDRSQSTPLHLVWSSLAKSSLKRITKAVQLLIQSGADVNARDRNQSTPLHLAQGAKMVQLLIQSGADVNARDRNQSTPLHQASRRSDTEAMQVLIQSGVDVNTRDKDQWTPLHLASLSPEWTNPEPAVHLLIEHGAGINAYDGNHKTPLHRLASSQFPSADSLHLLLENGADVDVEDDKSLTPFQIASSEGNYEIAQLLFDHKRRTHT